MSTTIHVEVAYATPTTQTLISLDVAPSCTAQEAIQHSGILAQHPEIDLTTQKIGIFSRPCELNALLRDHDRIEIYRTLLADPKTVRRQRAEAGKPLKKRQAKQASI